jgi:hypothetical protein
MLSHLKAEFYDDQPNKKSTSEPSYEKADKARNTVHHKAHQRKKPKA